MREPLGAESFRRILGPTAPAAVGDIETVGETRSRGAADIARELEHRGHEHATVHVRPGGHEFPSEDRELAHSFLESVLT